MTTLRFVFFSDLDKGVWIGGEDLDEDDVYRWTLTGQVIEVPGYGWHTGHPDMTKRCIKLAGPTSSQNLVTSICTASLHVLCEE